MTTQKLSLKYIVMLRKFVWNLASGKNIIILVTFEIFREPCN